MSDLISRADAMGAVQDHFNADGFKGYDDGQKMMDRINALPSAEANSDDLIIKGAKGIQDGLYNIKDGKLFKYKAIGGTVRTYEIVPSAEAVQKWIPCSERLPDVEYGEGDSVLCCTETGLMHILYWNGGNWCVPTGEPHQWINHKTGWHDKVIAWMPLPDPYKGGEEYEKCVEQMEHDIMYEPTYNQDDGSM